MARPRKTFISDAYAARQAAFAKLGVGTVISPLKHFRSAAAQASVQLHRALRNGFDVSSPEVKTLAHAKRRADLFCEHAAWYAETGQGRALQNLARRQFT